MIDNAKNKTLSQANLSVPNVADVVQGWLSTLTASKVGKTIVDGDVVETFTTIRFHGMIQPLSGIDLEIKPEGERHWEWVKIYTDYDNFYVDDAITIQGANYRIKHKMPYEKYGYGFYRYDCVKDYEEVKPDNSGKDDDNEDLNEVVDNGEY